MKKLLLLGAFLVVGALCLQDISVGHGGTYRGPGDTVPPGGGGAGGAGGPTTPGPSGPAGPVTGPVTGGSAPGSAPTSGPAGPTGTVTTGITDSGGSDLTVWQFWWGFNKDPYLNLKAAIHSDIVQTGTDDYFLGKGEKEQSKDTLRPSQEKVRQTIVPALLEALEKERQNDIVTGCMVALAKIGDAKNEQGESEFEKVISRFLKDSNQEIAETAAVALGILANDASVTTLTHMMKDDAQGRALVGQTEVTQRSRAFAAYGLGLIGYRTENNEVRKQICQSLIEILELPKMPARDLQVAALIALGLAPVDPAAEGEGEAKKDPAYYASSRQHQIRYLIEYFKDARDHDYLIRAQAPRAMALLCANVPELRTEVVEVLLEATKKNSDERNEVQQGCLLAMGQLGDADSEPLDKKIRETLMEAIEAGGDQQSKHFAVIALAQVAGRPGQDDSGYKDIKKDLTTKLAKSGGGMTRLKPWLGIGLGIMQHARTEGGQPPDREVAQVLRTALAECKTPADLGAYCIGAGISRDQEAKDTVLEKLNLSTDDEARGYAAIALGLMGARDSIEPIQKIVKESKYRPDLLKQAAIGLGLLGDKKLVPDLVSMLEQAKSLATQAAISSALGFIGDQRSIDPLVAMLKNQEITASARGFAAVALGIVADKEPLPWNSKISTNINYRANTTTLTGQNGTGILDIL